MDLKLPGIEACVFDAYGTLFDVNSAALATQDSLGEKWQPLAELWRAKQLQYTWLRSLAGRHADFWQVTGDALDFALASFELEDPELRARLMELYLALSVYPDVPDTLKRLKLAGMKLAILSNGSPAMLASAAANAGIAELFDAVLSVEEVKVYKPHPAVMGWPASGLTLRRTASAFSPPTAGTLIPPKHLVFAFCGATASVSRRKESRRRRTRRSPRLPNYRRSFWASKNGIASCRCRIFHQPGLCFFTWPSLGACR